MIKRIYIMRFNGTLLYSKHLSEGDRFDDNILIGFFASLANFSREALESEIEYIDLGHENKLILFPYSSERLLATAIVSTIDDNDLIMKILRDILQDFIGAFAPDYNPEKINEDEMESIIELNVSGKISYPLIKRLIFSWLLLIPLCIFLNFLNITSGDYIFQNLYLDKDIYTQEEIYTVVLPTMIRISLIVLLIVFILPNLISGYLVLNAKFAYLNSVIYIVLIMVIYFYTIQSLFAYVILAYLPLVFLISIAFAYIGFRYAKKRKIIRN